MTETVTGWVVQRKSDKNYWCGGEKMWTSKIDSAFWYDDKFVTPLIDGECWCKVEITTTISIRFKHRRKRK